MPVDIFGEPVAASGDNYAVTGSSNVASRDPYKAFGEYTTDHLWINATINPGWILYRFTDNLRRYIETITLRVYSPVYGGGANCGNLTICGIDALDNETTIATWTGTPSAANPTITLSINDTVGYYGFKFYAQTGGGGWYPGLSGIVAQGTVESPLGSYTIAYNSNGGTGTMENQTAYETTPIALSACAFTRDGYTFSGWAISSGGPVVYEDQETVTDIALAGETVTLYAVWAPIPFAFDIQFNASEPIALTKNVTTLLTLPGILREDCSIIDPVILIEADLQQLVGANYLSIPKFGRKYFILDMVSVRANFVEITAHCDVLSSFASGIRSNSGIVHRQEKKYNLLLNDGALQCYQNPLIDTIAFPGSFSGQSYVMLIGGNRGGGIVIGSGDGNIAGKTTSGLVAFVTARLGTPYWYGCYGQTATAALLNTMRTLYPANYTAADFPDQYGQHVQDCVGLVKSYRWSDDPSAEPVYNASEDVNVSGMYASCNERHLISNDNPPIIGSVLFNLALTHCGVYIGNGKIIEARGHAYGVVQTDISDAGRTWTWWGIPSWLTVSTTTG